MNEATLRLALYGGAALCAAAFIGLAVWAWRRAQRQRRRLVQLIESIAPDYQRDVLIPDGLDGWYHVDFLLRTSIGLVILDVRDVRGAVFGGEHMSEWTVMDRSSRRTFLNPLETLYDRMAAVRALGGDDVPVEGRVVLLSRARFATAAPPRTLLMESVADLAAPATEVGDLYCTAWREVSTQTQPTPRALRRSA